MKEKDTSNHLFHECNTCIDTNQASHGSIYFYPTNNLCLQCRWFQTSSHKTHNSLGFFYFSPINLVFIRVIVVWTMRLLYALIIDSSFFIHNFDVFACVLSFSLSFLYPSLSHINPPLCHCLLLPHRLHTFMSQNIVNAASVA